MKSAIKALLIGSILLSSAGAQESQRTALKQGISVQMAVASHAVEIRAADEPNATVVAIAADGKVFLGINTTEPTALSTLSADNVYVKADSQTPYQKVLAVLDALRGRSVVLLTAPPADAARQGVVAPYGVKLIVSR
jgi:hypothetical protein